MSTKVQTFSKSPRAKNQSQAQEHPPQKFAAEPPHASNIPPLAAELLYEWAAKSEEISQANTILDTIQIRCDIPEGEQRKKWHLNARNKHLQAPFMYDMIEHFKAVKNWDFERKFTRTYHCRHAYQVTHDGQALTFRCENRFCNFCSNVRAAILRDRYSKPLSALREVWFITVTGVVVMPGDSRLKERLRIYKKVWAKLISRYRQRCKRNGGSGDRIRGLRKLEIEISKSAKTFGYFHPHFHVITEGTESFVREFIADWVYELNRHGIKVSMKAQKAVKAQRDDDGNIKLVELTKYVTKSLVSDPDTGELKHVSEAAFAEIWDAVQGIRLIHPIDIKGEAAPDEEEDGDGDHPTTTQAPPDAKPGYYSWTGSDWTGRPIDAPNDSEEIPLTGYEPDRPTTDKHCRELPEWLREQQNAAAIAIQRARIKMRVQDMPVWRPENIDDWVPKEPDTKKEGEP